MKQTYYNILGINKNASTEEIKEAYKLLVKHFHPDLNHIDSQVIRKINEAYRVLSNRQSRIEYDESLVPLDSNSSATPGEWFIDIYRNMARYREFTKKEATLLKKDILSFKKYLDLIGYKGSSMQYDDVEEKPMVMQRKNRNFRAF